MQKTQERYVIWSIEHEAWWKPGAYGYTRSLAEAGHYAYADAKDIVADANIVSFNEAMIPVACLGIEVTSLAEREEETHG